MKPGSKPTKEDVYLGLAWDSGTGGICPHVHFHTAAVRKNRLAAKRARKARRVNRLRGNK